MSRTKHLFGKSFGGFTKTYTMLVGAVVFFSGYFVAVAALVFFTVPRAAIERNLVPILLAAAFALPFLRFLSARGIILNEMGYSIVMRATTMIGSIVFVISYILSFFQAPTPLQAFLPLLQQAANLFVVSIFLYLAAIFIFLDVVNRLVVACGFSRTGIAVALVVGFGSFFLGLLWLGGNVGLWLRLSEYAVPFIGFSLFAAHFHSIIKFSYDRLMGATWIAANG